MGAMGEHEKEGAQRRDAMTGILELKKLLHSLSKTRGGANHPAVIEAQNYLKNTDRSETGLEQANKLIEILTRLSGK